MWGDSEGGRGLNPGYKGATIVSASLVFMNAKKSMSRPSETGTGWR